MSGDPSQSPPEARRGRALAYLLAYVLASLPGAYAAVRGSDAASRGTVERVNAEKSRDVLALQAWARASREDLDRVARAAEERTERLRGELRSVREELSRAILELALRRRVREETRERLEEPPRVVLPAPPPRPARRSLPKLRAPAGSLEQLEAKAVAE